MKQIILVVLILMIATTAFASGMSSKEWKYMHEKYTPNTVCEPVDMQDEYKPEYQVIGGAEVNVLPPKYKKALVGEYLQLDQVNVGHYINCTENPMDIANHTTAIVAHFNLFKE